MKSLRRFGGAMALVFSTAGIVACVLGLIGIWMFRHHASERVRRISTGIDVGLQRASAASQNVQRAVAKARADVAEVRDGSADLGNDREKSSRVPRAVRALIQQRVGPDIEDLGGRLATLADAAVAVSSVLQSFQELPAAGNARIPPDQLNSWKDEVQQLSATFRRLEGVVCDEDKETSGREVAATSDVDLALQRWQAKVDNWQSDVDVAREQVQHIQAEINRWLTPAAITVTLVLVWVAMGQFSLFAHAVEWRRKV